LAVFPPAAAVTVVLDGKTVRSYTGAFESSGRVYAPLRPFVTGIADAMWFDGDSLVIVRDGRSVTVRIPSREPDALDHAYVPLAPILRSLGETVEYEPIGRVVVRSPYEAVIATPTPFDPTAPSALARPVFTPAPVATPRPIWTGSPLPRRTPIPYPTNEPR
jgi:hypothetical protein